MNISILLVEDNPGDVRLIKELLSESGLTIDSLVHSERLETALEELNKVDYSIVLLDLSLPDSQGLKTISKVLTDFPDIPIVVLTGNIDESQAAEAVQTGAQDYIRKDQLSSTLLNHAVRYALERQKYLIERKQYLELQRSTLVQTIEMMALTIEKRDPYTSGHQKGVARIASKIAEQMGLPQDQIDGIYLSGLIHDIGKISVPAEYLNRAGKLRDEEMSLVKSHVEVGYDIVKGVDFPWPVANMVCQHHERFDGSGYPQGLVGKDILIGARIIAVADVIEAMASHRPYRSALGIDAAMKEIEKNKNILYDPDVVEAVLTLFRDQGFSVTT
jgi:putative two-component system response regulator